MRKSLWSALLVLLVLSGCTGSRSGVIDGFGTFEVAKDRLELKVSTRGMSLVQYELRDPHSGRLLVQDQCGGGRNRWFVYFDKYDRLWVYSEDVGTAVWVTSDGRHFSKQWLNRGSPHVRSVPPAVYKKLPDWVKRRVGLL